MGLTIQTTGLEQYGAGGEGRLQIMLIGGPGAGKTRVSSYWPRPIYANCEKGLSSVADRKVPFVDIRGSQDMLDLLHMLDLECRRPFRDRQYQTVVVDTLDAFQRKLKDEWLRANPGAQGFRGFDAWAFLDTKMQLLLTRLLNLDMNVIVLAHYKDKTIKEGVGESATERQELMLQLSGEVKDSVFNDFDLVGWIGTFWEVEEGQRVEKRGLTFKRTPEKPFLKDRLNVTPPWMEVRFSDEDYSDLFAAVISRLDDFEPSQEVGEVPSSGPEGSIPTGGVVGPMSGGPLTPVDPKDVPLIQFDKPTLQKMARELGIEFRGNHIKAELVEMIEKKRAELAAAESHADAASPPATEAPATLETAVDAPATPVAAAEPAANPNRRAEETDYDPPMALEDLAASAVTTPTVATEAGDVDPKTGEITTPMSEAQVADALGGQVVSATPIAEEPSVETAPATGPEAPAGASAKTCEECGISLADQNRDYVALAFIKFRKHLCNEHYLAAKR